MTDKHLTSISTKLFDAIHTKATDRDGLSAGDRHDISKQFGRTRAESTRICKALEVFDDLIIDKGEHNKLVHLLNLNGDAQSRLAGIIGHDGNDLLRQQFTNNPGAAHAKLRGTKASVKIRVAAAQHIGRSNDPAAQHVLTKALKIERDWSVRFAIAKALIRLDSSARKRTDVVDAFLNAYKAGDEQTRSFVMSRLRGVRDSRITDIFIDASAHRNPAIRRASVHVLAKLNDPRAKTVVLKAIKDPDPLVRAAVPQSLRNEVARVKGLLKLMKSRHVNRDYIVKQLSSVKEPVARLVVAELIKMFGSRDARIRWTAAKALKSFGGKEVIEAFASLLNDRNDKVRIAAVNYLAQLNDNRAVPALIVALTNPDAAVCTKALFALKRYIAKDPRVVPAFIAALKYHDVYVRTQTVKMLSRIKDPRIVPVLIASLKDGSELVRKQAIWSLGEIKDRRVVPAIIAALKDKNRDVRWEAARALYRLKDPRAVPALITALKDRDEGVRKQAIRSLGEIEDRRVVPALIAVLKDWNVRWWALRALGKIKDRRAVPALIALLKDRWDVRQFTARALGEIKDKRAVPALIAALKDCDEYVRMAAVNALGAINDKRAVPALIAALKDRDDGVRSAAAKALGAINDKRAMPALIAALKNRYWTVREAAKKALCAIKDKRAVPALIALLKDSRDRQFTARALGEIKDKRAVPALIAALKDRDVYVRRAAVKALGAINDKRAVPALIAALKDRYWTVRAAAKKALKDIGMAIPRTSP